MIIVGVKCGGHDPAMAILKDGSVVCAAEEERFTRVKHSHGSLPIYSVQWGLGFIGARPEDVDYWVMHHASPMKLVFLTISPYLRKPPKNKSELRFAAIEIRNVLRYFLLNYLRGKTPSQRFFEHLGVTKPNTIYVEHHVAHGMSASLFSGLAKGLSISMDGKGDGTSVMVATFNHLAIQDKRKSIFHVTKRFDPRFSLGLSYSGFTKFLGFEPNDAEYKVMGLASYGSPNISLEKIYGYSRNGKPTRKVAPFVYNWRKSRHLTNFFGIPPRIPDAGWQAIHANIAASVQKTLEDSALAFAKREIRLNKSSNLVLSGGVCLNVKMNMVLRESLQIDSFFVQPVSSDAGLPLGCVGYGYSKLTNKLPSPIKSLHLGPDISEFSIDEITRDKRVSCETLDNLELLCQVIADAISKGSVIAWMQGRMEFGPRSLGARSILADPRNAENRDRVNAKIKFRELFRPFCPSMLKEDFEKYVEVGSNWHKSRSLPFMVEAFKANQIAIQEIPAVVHIDKTFRPQVLTGEINCGSEYPYQLLLREFKKITGIGVLLNTSLNRRGEPIACNPNHGLEIFLNTDLDLLVIGRTIVRKIERV